ncbi:MAG: hypothetical protein JXR25_08970 [Pontiellaceae bacterium]|nr:hypothetical protein [Pontiellaceae bacterium]MBN2784947.1 hypothetical protein [Pontiellaceae bacterium]
MKRKIFSTYTFVAAMVLSGPVLADITIFPVVGEYDGSPQGNVADRDASFYSENCSGVGDDSGLILHVDSFRAEILEAFTNNCGGVVSFDNALIKGGTQTDTFAAQFAGEKKLIVKSIDHIRTDVVATNIFMPISGPGEVDGGGFLAKSVVGKDRISIRSSFNFTFTEDGFGENEHVRAIAGTILGRNGAVDASKWLMKVMLDNGDVIAQIADLNFRTGKARDDTFFGARAPEGRYITGLMFINLDGNHTGLDSLAFITNGEPRKPATPSGSNSGNFFGIEYDPNGGSSSGGSSDDNSSGASLLFGRERR